MNCTEAAKPIKWRKIKLQFCCVCLHCAVSFAFTVLVLYLSLVQGYDLRYEAKSTYALNAPIMSIFKGIIHTTTKADDLENGVRKNYYFLGITFISKQSLFSVCYRRIMNDRRVWFIGNPRCI